MGNTLEHLIVEVLGVAARGADDDPPFDHATGLGRVAATVDHQYADAQRRGHRVTLLATESTGAISPTLHEQLRALDKASRLPTTQDSTIYGVARSSPRTHLTHHLAAISHAIVTADAATVLEFAAVLNARLTLDLIA